MKYSPDGLNSRFELTEEISGNMNTDQLRLPFWKTKININVT